MQTIQYQFIYNTAHRNLKKTHTILTSSEDFSHKSEEGISISTSFQNCLQIYEDHSISIYLQDLSHKPEETCTILTSSDDCSHKSKEGNSISTSLQNWLQIYEDHSISISLQDWSHVPEEKH